MVKITQNSYNKQSLIYNGGAFCYALISYTLGLYGLFHMNLIINFAAILLLSHGMIIAAYLVHECAHNLVFKKMQHNTFFGKFLVWICGASYGTYEDIRYKHFRHHVDNDDVVWFDYEAFFRKHPRILRLTQILEWFYIPVHDLIMHFIMVFTSFVIPQRRNQRKRNLLVILTRGSLFIMLTIYYPQVAFFYILAYLIMMTVLRFMDSIQHDYSYNLTLFTKERSPRKGDFNWEQEHTFSNPISMNIPFLNWATLNFGFHNAHHADMSIPWYKLPDKHKELFGENSKRHVPFLSQLKIFHKQRVNRIIDNHNEESPTGNDYLIAARKAEVSGGNAASFLTSF
jgi:fatty acid desaturase|tara:strand:+ start:23398 stop:24423 length:1026 start_codon:yes stop_codon:yes gene_type:complete